MCLRSTNERLLYLCQSLLSKHSLDFPFVDIQMRCPCSSSDRFLAVLLSTHIADLCCVSFPHVQILGLLVQEELELLEVATFLDRTLIVVQNYSAFLQSVFLVKYAKIHILFRAVSSFNYSLCRFNNLTFHYLTKNLVMT